MLASPSPPVSERRGSSIVDLHGMNKESFAGRDFVVIGKEIQKK